MKDADFGTLAGITGSVKIGREKVVMSTISRVYGNVSEDLRISWTKEVTQGPMRIARVLPVIKAIRFGPAEEAMAECVKKGQLRHI